MKAVVFAYHSMGVIGLQKLLEHGFAIALVFTHEDDPHENIWFGSVRAWCAERGIDYVTPANPNSAEWIERVRALQPDIIFSFYYRHMLSMDMLQTARLGAYNLHGSLLPKYRGRCPVNWVLVKGETQTGVTLHEMAAKPDAGGIVAQRAVAISFEDTAQSLFAKLEEHAALLLDEALPLMRSGNIQPIPMDLTQGSYFGGRKPEDGRIDWQRPAREIYNLIRAVTKPYPGAFSMAGAKKIIFWRAQPVEANAGAPGLILENQDNQIVICTGEGVLIPIEIEVDGKQLQDNDLHEFLTQMRGEALNPERKKTWPH